MAGVQLHGNIENRRDRAFGRSGRSKNEAGFEGRLRGEQLGGEVLVALHDRLASPNS